MHIFTRWGKWVIRHKSACTESQNHQGTNKPKIWARMCMQGGAALALRALQISWLCSSPHWILRGIVHASPLSSPTHECVRPQSALARIQRSDSWFTCARPRRLKRERFLTWSVWSLVFSWFGPHAINISTFVCANHIVENLCGDQRDFSASSRSSPVALRVCVHGGSYALATHNTNK